VCGPTCLDAPGVDELVHVTTAREMRDAVIGRLGNCDVLVMAAAVADFRPKRLWANKIKKSDGVPVIELERTADILAEAALTKGTRMHVGFAAETSNLIGNARSKLEAKNLDLVVANDLTEEGAGFGAETNRATLLWRDGRVEALPMMSKRALAEHIIEAVVDLYGG
jgi:phosphopantothenoylcysteine decarboxylase/phosphopantothenate--cysteine ligase